MAKKMPEKKSAGSLRHTGDPLEENLTFTEAYRASILRAIIINVFLYLVSTAWQFDGFHSSVGVGHHFHARSIGTVSTFHTHHGEVAHTCHSLNGGHSWCACGNVVKTVGIERSDGPSLDASAQSAPTTAEGAALLRYTMALKL